MPNQSVGALTYNRSQVTPTTIITEYRKSAEPDNGNKLKLEQYMSLSTNAVAQVSTITLAVGTNGNDYVIPLTSGGEARTYRHQQAAGDTAATMAAFLALLISTHTFVIATSTGNVITVTASVPGQAFTLTNTGSTTVGNVTIATPTANAGTAKHRKRWDVYLTFGVLANGSEELNVEGTIYDGANPPAPLSTFGPTSVTISPRNLSEIQTVA